MPKTISKANALDSSAVRHWLVLAIIHVICGQNDCGYPTIFVNSHELVNN